MTREKRKPEHFKDTKLRRAWWRIRFFASMHPVISGMTIAFCIMVYPVSMLIGQQAQLRTEQRQGSEQREKLSRQTAELRAQGRQIQQQREDNVRRGCEERNRRNDKASKFLAGLPVDPNAPKMTPEQRTKLLHDFTDALVGPKQDCATLVKRTVTTKPKRGKE